MDRMPNMAEIRELADAARTPKERVINRIDGEGDKLASAYEELGGMEVGTEAELAEILDVPAIQAWHQQALAVSNAASRYAAEIHALYLIAIAQEGA